MKNLKISIFFLFLLLSCFKNKNISTSEEIILPPTLIPTELNQWGVIKYDYTRLREEPFDSNDVRYDILRISSVVEIIIKGQEIKTLNNIPDYWYYVDYEKKRGWVFGQSIEIYNTYEESAKRSGEISQNR